MSIKVLTSNLEVLILLMIMFILAIIVVFVLLLVRSRSKKKMDNFEIEFLESFTEHFRPTLGIEKNLDYILLKTQELLTATNYSFYVFNHINQRFMLKAVRQMISETTIAPSYSGLLPYEKEKFDPPLSLSLNNLTDDVTLTKEGEVPLITVPIKGGYGLIRIGPVSKIPKKTLTYFQQVSRLLEVPLKNLIEEEDQRRAYEVLETSSQSLKLINRLFLHDEEFVKMVIQNCIGLTKPSACLVLVSNPVSNKITLSSGIDEQVNQTINSNPDFLAELKAVIGDQSFAIFHESSSQSLKLKQLFSISSGDYFLVCKFNLQDKEYIALFSFEIGSQTTENNRIQTIKMLWTQLQKFRRIKHQLKQGSGPNIEFLKLIADLIDQMSPSTVGSSKLMSNYSMAIAKELGLSNYHVHSIGLAAYLSNIGIIGLSDGLLNKEGLYSDKEYEQMKLHSEVGAVIIEHMIAQDDVVSYVRHHHERIDGNGYPSRLTGEAIPMGARIIAVVQTFIAKVNGRNYRQPLPFDEALNLIKNSSGSQLDRKVVDVFIKWYEKRRTPFLGQKRALGNCWDISCVPSFICSQCSVYGNTTKNCWEYEKNNCLAHGKVCETCFVYTETMSRIGKKKEAII